MDDDAGIELLKERAARDYNPPPPTPREEMWAVLEARIRAEGAPGRSGGDPSGRRPLRDGVVPIGSARGRRAWSLDATSWIGLAAAACAALLLGVGIGRMTAPAPPDAPLSARSAGAVAEAEPALQGPSEGVRRVAAGHLAASESLLGFVQADAQAGRVDEALGRWGRGLLVETRMLLDTEAGSDPALRDLLLDLELILAQVAVLAETDGPERGREELRLITQGLEEQKMMSRIQTALPAFEIALSGS